MLESKLERLQEHEPSDMGVEPHVWHRVVVVRETAWGKELLLTAHGVVVAHVLQAAPECKGMDQVLD